MLFILLLARNLCINLSRNQFRVKSFLDCQKISMSSNFLDLSLLENHNSICISNRTQSMCNQYDRLRSMFRQPIYRFLHLKLTFRIERTRRFIKYKYSRVLNQRSCNRNTLLLPTWQLDTSFSDNSVQSFWEYVHIVHEVLCICHFQCIIDVLLTEAWHTVGNVVPQWAWE